VIAAVFVEPQRREIEAEVVAPEAPVTLEEAA
jgi:hypothetical protein